MIAMYFYPLTCYVAMGNDPRDAHETWFQGTDLIPLSRDRPHTVETAAPGWFEMVFKFARKSCHRDGISVPFWACAKDASRLPEVLFMPFIMP